MDGFFAQLCSLNADIHRRTLDHPAVHGIGAGTLGDDTFRFYLGQDFLFLREYARVIALAVAAADDMDNVIWLSDLLHATVGVEMDGVRRLHAAFGGHARELDAVRADPACRAYTDHLLARAGSGNLMVILASLLPCQWGYREIARCIEERGLPVDARYLGWVREYLSPDYSLLVDRMIAALDLGAACEGLRVREVATSAFTASIEHELRFWDMVIAHDTRTAARQG